MHWARHHRQASPEKTRRRGAFTLIELLVVVAIIGILAAIAITNLLYAQIKAKVGRAYADMQSISTALETYRIDEERYPITDWEFVALPYQKGWETPKARREGQWGIVHQLTSPISYIAMWPEDPFRRGKMVIGDGLYYDYYHWETIRDVESFGLKLIRENILWMVFSRGPNEKDIERGGFMGGMEYSIETHYDPTNGLVSPGRIVRFNP